ncbi:MAG: amidohydrolase family protein, partial [Deltaproteobacteria bacterium]|nr:amidohydrolase family protein [Deltaproteobacteria bacterium]
KTARVRPFQLESIRLAHGAGVTIAAGTDAGTPFNRHGDNLQEIKHLVEIGLSPIEALKAGTHLAAQVLGLEEELGLIEEGKLADLVAVKDSPMDDVGLLTEPENIRLVMRSGRIIKE